MIESYSTLAYTVICMNLEDIMLRQTSWSEREKHWESLLIGGEHGVLKFREAWEGIEEGTAGSFLVSVEFYSASQNAVWLLATQLCECS